MTCETVLPLIGPYLDGELDAAQTVQVAQHLDECVSCVAHHRKLSGLRADLQALAQHDTAPERLRARVLSTVRQAAAAAPIPATKFPAGRTWAMAATVLLAVSLGWNVVQWRSGKSAGDAVAGEIVASHIRSLIGQHLLDEPSTDQHNVKPWFNGKLDYSPDVKDFASSGFPLIGGRVDYLDGRRVAALVYKRREHVINLFVWPSGSTVEAPEDVAGFHLVAWAGAGMNYWAISDVSEAELHHFAELYRQ